MCLESALPYGGNLPAVGGAELAENRWATAEFIAASKADATHRAYGADWRQQAKAFRNHAGEGFL